jgi:hypothetical protein
LANCKVLASHKDPLGATVLWRVAKRCELPTEADRTQTRTHSPVVLAAILFLLSPALAASQGLSIFDRDLPAHQEVLASLELAQKLSVRPRLTATEFLNLYYAEKKIGRCVWGPSPRFKDPELRDARLIGYCRDSILSERCVNYVKANRSRFRVVDDEWKGENNFWEPTDVLLKRVKRAYPNSPEALEIEFDLEFNQFIRRFYIDPSARGKSCDQYCEELLEDAGDMYREVYSAEEISRWPSECASTRDEFEAGRKWLLDKYKNAPFTKKLQEIDVTTIVVLHSVC